MILVPAGAILPGGRVEATGSRRLPGVLVRRGRGIVATRAGTALNGDVRIAPIPGDDPLAIRIAGDLGAADAAAGLLDDGGRAGTGEGLRARETGTSATDT
jgi:hypothetical protein